MSLSRFKACLVGAVLGDCIGALYEGISQVQMSDILDNVATLEKNRKLQQEQRTRPAHKYGCSYTDDTAMAKNVAASLIEKKKFDAWDMARRFSEEYFKEPTRGYGGNIVTVFEGLRDPNLTDVYKPASDQFDGRGSYGNGGAMRIAPASLFAFHDNDLSKLKSLVSSITRLTHTNDLAINGAILQALAVDESLRLSQGEVDADAFISSLISKLEPIERESHVSSTEPPPAKKTQHARKLDMDPTPYCAKLKRIQQFLKLEDLNTHDVVEELGHDVSAVGSVPAAVLAFLRAATQTIPGCEGRNKFEQTVLYAISLGGDTDTIATMAAAMGGALYGMEQVPEAWQYYCEGVADAETMAEELFRLGNAGDGQPDGIDQTTT